VQSVVLGNLGVGDTKDMTFSDALGGIQDLSPTGLGLMAQSDVSFSLALFVQFEVQFHCPLLATSRIGPGSTVVTPSPSLRLLP
jgi:hypothetical protein